MPKIVDKAGKKREIALAALEVFAEYGLQNTSVDQVAKAAGIGKGTVYLYFSNKEEIVLEIWASVYEYHDEWLNTQLASCQSEAEKIGAYLYLGHIEQAHLKKNFALFRDFIAAGITQASPLFQDFSRKHFARRFTGVKKHLEAGIQSGEFRPVDTNIFAELFVQTHDGIVCSAMERGLGAEHIGATLPKLLQTLLQTLKKEENR